ncbi:DUF3667 domain-containing protein [Undibacterium baiyunense]|uniref:DUF3667 domain-containing protein n=1 Tax=Undibacterium baiyunense TaxID=2828731 RepID=A0A941DEA8_9BURK|nr:DUF3667 domain-containing protein [Undibacterium baiyunense]MBR7747223.1 DUF3667 domain-containing protein [Undibacterium baiyunense]
MGIELSGAGEALTAIVVSDELSKEVGKSPSGHKDDHSDQNDHANKDCANCGTQLTGAFCHACGQSAHIHRSLLHMVEEALHGILHFDTKAWRTIPALIFRPGHLTKQYIEGKRTSFVSPLALFLFLIFLMFFIFSYTSTESSNALLSSPNTREEIVKELSNAEEKLNQQLAEQVKQGPFGADAFELQSEISDAQFEIRKLKDVLNESDGKKKDLVALNKELAITEANLKLLREAKLKLKRKGKESVAAEATSSVSAIASSSASASLEENAASSSVQNANEQTKDDSASKATLPIEKLQPWEINPRIQLAEREVKYLKKQIAAGEKDKAKEQENSQIEDALKAIKNGDDQSPDTASDTKASASNAAGEKAKKGIGTDIDIQNSSSIPYVADLIDHAKSNPELTLYKMKKNASGLAFLLVPLTLPFLWLLFAFNRKFVMFDHAVFALYSLSFMCLLLSTISILSYFGFEMITALLFAFVPPVHMYAQLRHAYSLGTFATLWRTIALLFIALISLSLFAAVVTIASA